MVLLSEWVRQSSRFHGACHNSVMVSTVEDLDTKQRILDAASTLFNEGGIGALSVRAIARRAGMSTIGIYSHFEGKQGILDALYVEGFEKVRRAMRPNRAAGNASLSEQADREAAVLSAVDRYLDNAERFEGHYRLIFGESDDGFVPSEASREVAATAFHELTELIGSVLPQPSTPAQRRDAALEAWALLHGFVSLKQHTSAEIFADRGWKQRARRAVERWIAARRVDDREGPSPS